MTKTKNNLKTMGLLLVILLLIASLGILSLAASTVPASLG